MIRTIGKLVAIATAIMAMADAGTNLFAGENTTFSRNDSKTNAHFTAYWCPRESIESVKDWVPLEKNKKGIESYVLAIDYFKTLELNCAPDHLYAYWNRNKDNPLEKSLHGAAVISVFTAPSDGVYSVSGTPAWRLVTFKDCRSALYKVARVQAPENTVTPLFEVELNEPGPAFKEPRKIQGFKDYPRLRNIELKKGDQLAFILAASSANYRGVMVDDSTVVITTDANRADFSKAAYDTSHDSNLDWRSDFGWAYRGNFRLEADCPAAGKRAGLPKEWLWRKPNRFYTETKGKTQMNFKPKTLQRSEDITMDEMVARTLVISAAEKERLTDLEVNGILTVKPVALPVGPHLKGKNHHLGWPVGIKIGKTLLCAYHQTLRHHGGGPSQDANSSDAVIVRSTDGGNTWSDPIDIRQFGTSEKAMVLNFGNCFGILDGKVFLATKYGLYRSEDEGKSWTLLPDALTQDQTGHKYTDHFGPRMIVHPDRGLGIPVGVERSPYIDMYSSKDEGLTWTHERVTLSDKIHPLEPTAIYHDGRLIFLTRNHTLPFKWHQQLRETQRPAMLVSDTGWFPMTHQQLTNISSYRWPDTTDVDFNPVTKRFEAVVTNRSGGAEKDEKNERHEQTVNLWSLSQEDMYAGRADKWRFEGTLLRLKSGMLGIAADDIDAAHPGGAVIDEDEGVQHIFIYCGRYSTPAGIYRISRTLDTNKLREAMSQQGSEGDTVNRAP